MVSERYLGSAADIAAAFEGREQAMMPERTRHLAFGAAAAAWGMLTELDVAGLIDEVIGRRRRDVSAPAGTYLALAALNRLVAPCSKLQFGTWWAKTAADRFTKIPASVLDHRKFWDAMHAVTPGHLEEVSRRLAVAIAARYQLDVSSVSLDMTNFATFIDTGNQRAPIAQRGKAKQKRTDLRLIGLGLVVTRDGGIPLAWHAYPGNKPDVTQFPAMIDQLAARYAAICAALPGDTDPDLTVVFDAGQNSDANFAHLAGARLHYVGSVPASGCPGLLAVPAASRTPVAGYEGLTALDTRREVYGAERRAILTHSPELHAAQVRSFEGTTLAKAARRLDELAAALARGATRRPRQKVEAEIENITTDTWVRRVLTWRLTGDTPRQHRLAWHIDQAAYAALEDELFGKHVLITDRDDWPVTDVVAGYRSQSDAEFSFRQMKDPHVCSFSPMHHWTDHNIRVHLFTCVLALVTAHLMRRQAARHGVSMPVRVLLDTLAGIEETVLIYPPTGGRPKARRMLTEMTPDQQKLYEIFSLDRWASQT
jgi:transposase